MGQFHIPLLTFQTHKRTNAPTLYTHTYTYTYSKEFGTLLPIYVMHLVKLLFPKSLILDLFVVQIKCILVFSPGSRGKIPKNIWILSQYWRLLVLVTRAWMLKWFQFQPTHPPTIVLNLSLLFSGKHGPLPPHLLSGRGGSVKKRWPWWLFSSWRIRHNIFMKFDWIDFARTALFLFFL